MIKKISFLIITLIFISSCANKFSLQKRKYNKGFYFANSKHHSVKAKTEPMHHSVVVNNLPVKETINLHTNKDDLDRSLVLTEITKGIVKSSNLKTDDTEKKKNITASANKKSVFFTKVFKDLKIETPKHKLGVAKKADSDIDLIILVILSLFPFICLIAVFLKDGKSITLNFWIDLLLHLTVIGEIIFALLVVLDIVNLA